MDDSFVNLGEEVILTLLWQSAASESATASFVISLSICYWLFKRGVLRVVCVRERESQLQRCVCVYVCIMCVCVCVCSEGDEVTHSPACLQKHMSFIAICHAILFPFWAWTDGKTNDIINCLYFSFKSWSSRLRKGSYISDTACGVRPITMHCDSWPIRTDCACRK